MNTNSKNPWSGKELIHLLSLRMESFDNNAVCMTKSCLKSSVNLIECMNDTIDPCEDFYEFACGSFEENHPSFTASNENSWDTILTQKASAIVKRFLEEENKENEPEAIHKTRKFYQSCLDAVTGKMDKKFNTLKNVWMDIGLDTDYLDDSVPLDVERVLAKYKSNLNLDIFFGLNVYDDPRNSSRTLLVVHQTDVLPYSKNRINIVTDESITVGIPKYIDLYESLVDLMLNRTQRCWNPRVQDLLSTSQELYDLSRKLIGVKEYSYPNKSYIPEVFTIGRLQKLTDQFGGHFQFNWTTFMRELFGSTDPEVYRLVNEDDRDILVYNKYYLIDVFSILANTTKAVIKMSVLEHGLRAIDNILPIAKMDDKYCMTITKDLFNMATGYAFKNAQNDDTKIAVNRMVDSIVSAFRKMIGDARGMDDKTKTAILRKQNHLKWFIGYPDNYEHMLDQLYGELKVTEDHAQNVLSITRHQVKLLWRELLNTTDVEFMEWEVPPDEVNAYNLNSRVAFFMSAAILQSPLYYNGVQSIDYGITGSTIGHEMTHNYDNTGRLFNELGNVQPWLTDKFNKEYKRKINCLINHYDGTPVTINNQTFKLDGVLTLDENIADLVGLKQAYLAYQSFVKVHGKEPRLPGLERYTNEQLFFLGYANQYCNFYYEDPQDEMENVHSPKTVRVRSVLSLLPEFADVWSCPVGSKMNPKVEKCQIW
ncbi:neprilysin-1-like isoform X2 [Adelges cooleyi]|uniref:neprilysin-1-like isoform X2 n=1 Tax=Adelges cooleyi TaxID=133065 RepID=UPI00217F496E|nr:neprilysin-1-like isoform X2 [Adelges cooleyi]